jgi:methionine-S-sulfoxide reductase
MQNCGIMRILLITIYILVMNNINNDASNNKTIYLGGGCFWCVESVFSRLKGIESAVSGYMGGTVDNPTYREVCSGTTGHAEVVKLVYNTSKITLKEILEVFFTIHDPTTLNRQGNDIGTQYRSVIFWTDTEQQRLVSEFISNLNVTDKYDNPIVTQVVAASTFFEAEEYHQGYFDKNPSQPYCRIIIAPKVKNAITLFGELSK